MARKPKFTQRESLGLRVSPELKQWLDEAAARSGRSQSTEAAIRLERSFVGRTHLLAEVLELAYGSATAGIVMMVAAAMEDAGSLYMAGTRRRATDVHWTDDPAAYEIALRTAFALLIAMRPEHRQPNAPKKAPRKDRELAEHQLDRLALAIRSGGSDGGQRTVPWADPGTIRSLLGPLAKRLTDTRLAQAKRALRHARGVSHPSVIADAHLPADVGGQVKNPASLALAVMEAASALQKLDEAENGVIDNIEEIAPTLERYLGDFLVPDWQQRMRAQPEPEASADNVKRRA